MNTQVVSVVGIRGQVRSVVASCRKRIERVVIVVKGNAKLLEVVAALHPPRSFARRLNGGQEQRHKNANDCNDNEQLDEGETPSRGLSGRSTDNPWRSFASICCLDSKNVTFSS